MMSRCIYWIALAGIVLPFGWSATSTGPTATPNTLSFSYTVNSTKLPAAAKLTVSLPSTAPSSTGINIAVSWSGTPQSEQGWLTVAPSGQGLAAPVAATVMANPTGLPPGTLTATLLITTTPATQEFDVPVTLTIANAAAQLVPAGPTLTQANGSTPATLNPFTYTTGTGVIPPPQEVDISTNGGIIPFNVTVASASAAGSGKTPVWLRVATQNPVTNPGTITSTQTSGVAVAGRTVPIFVWVDAATVAQLLPGSYAGTVTFAAQSAANGTIPVSVSLVVSAGAPGIGSIFPTNITQISATATNVVSPVITINGTNFFSTSVVTIAPYGGPSGAPLNQCTQSGASTQVPAQVLSQQVISGKISNAQSLFSSPGSWCICVTNPAPPNNPAQPPACTPDPSNPSETFTVNPTTQVSVSTVTNAASYQPTATQIAPPDPANGNPSISPGEIVSIFGQNLGPSAPLAATAVATPSMVTSFYNVGATLDIASVAATKLIVNVTNVGIPGSPTAFNVDFTDNRCFGGAAPTNAELLQDVIDCINVFTAPAGSFQTTASSFVVNNYTYITLTSAATGSAMAIDVPDNVTARLLKFTTGNGVATHGSGADVAFPFLFQYSGTALQAWFQFGTPPNMVTTLPVPIMASNNQINAVVPLGVQAGAVLGQQATLWVENGGNWANQPPASPPSLYLVKEDPGIFTLTGQGTGQGAVLNYDATSGSYTINSSKNSQTRGNTIVIYATGLGVLNTTLGDGVAAPATPLDKVHDPVQVMIDGQPSVVTYAGTSGGSIGGLIQINAIVPPTVSTGQTVSLVIAGGDAVTARKSQAGVTIAVK